MAAAAAVDDRATAALRAGLLLLVLTALPDVLDGAVAKASGTASPRGAFFDSVVDRVSDALLLGGVAWYLASTQPRPHRRAAAGGAGGLDARSPTSGPRPSPWASTPAAASWSGPSGSSSSASACCSSRLLVPVLWVMLVLTLVTAVQRFVQGVAAGVAPRRRSPLGRPLAAPAGSPARPATWRRQAVGHRRAAERQR